MARASLKMRTLFTLIFLFALHLFRPGATVRSMASGRWSAGETWEGGHVLAAGDVVQIRANVADEEYYLASQNVPDIIQPGAPAPGVWRGGEILERLTQSCGRSKITKGNGSATGFERSEP